MSKRLKKPSFQEERDCAEQGYHLIAGIDEVGRGPLAGPVVAAAVILPLGLKSNWLKEVKDSKQLAPEKRESLLVKIKKVAITMGVGVVPNEVIDSRGIAAATRLAMKIAVEQLLPRAEFLLIDYVTLPDVPLRQKGVKYGDESCFSIACASIIAKVTRDRLMVELDRIYPGYGLAQHKGYGTAEHLECLRRLGPSPIHRRSFQPVKEVE